MLVNYLFRWKWIYIFVSFNENIINILEEYKRLGPLLAVFLPLIEAFLPFLPLILFVIANSAVFGLYKGFLYSWLGTSIGCLLVFWLLRKLKDTRLLRKLKKRKRIQRIIVWVERRGFGPLFILLCFPFSPSAIINVVAGISRIHFLTFAMAVFLGKAIMIFTISFVGSSLTEFASNPIRTVIIGTCIVLFWLLGKRIEKVFQRGKKEIRHDFLRD